MFELLKSLGFALLMVPVVMVLIMGIIYGLGEIFNLISPGQSKADKKA
ncbi:TPA: AcrZ family multidrug efflux pump-associated protein [Proteus mirabilis]